MLTLIYGTDRQGTRKALEEEKKKFLKESPSAVIVVVSGDEAGNDTLTTLTEETDLFSQKQMIVLSEWCKDADAKEFLLANLESLSASSKFFIVLENAFDARLAKKIGKVAISTHACEEDPYNKKQDFNIFTLANALGERDKKRMWLLLMNALEKGIAPEEIHGTLFWQVKAMSLAKDAAEGKESNTGLNPFVLKNATRYAKNFTNEELTKLSQDLVDTYHRAHQGETEFAHALERIALTI